MKKAIRLIYILILLSLFSCQKDNTIYHLIELNKEKVTKTNYKQSSLDELYYALLHQISFNKADSLTSIEFNYYEKSALKQKDSLHIYRANNLYITLNPNINLDNSRFALVFKSLKYFENKNLTYDSYYANFILGEYYLALQYYKVAENFIFKSLKSLGIKDNEYAYEKALASMTAANILFRQKRYTESYEMIQTYEKYRDHFDNKVFSADRINLLTSFYYNNAAVIGNFINKIDYKQSIEYFHKANNLIKDQDNSNTQKGNTAFNIFACKIKNEDKDSIEFYFKEFIALRKPFDHNSQVQLNFAEIPLYYLQIKKDTVAAKKYQKELLLENKLRYKNSYLEKKIYEQLIIQTDSFSPALYKDYFTVLEKIDTDNKTKFGTNQKIVFRNQSLLNENAKLKRGFIYLVSIILVLSVTIFFIILNIIQKISYNKIKLKNSYLEQDTKAFEVTLKYKNDIENKLLLNKKQIFMELHDSIVNKLFSIRFMLHKDYITENSFTTTKQTLEDVKNTLLRICDNFTEINDLFEKNSFEQTLIDLIENQPKNKILFHYSFDNTIDWTHISPKVRFHLYRIIQELLQNIHKHSSATQASIELVYENSVLKLLVFDNGKGFRKSSKKGIGLSNIAERLKEINGDLKMNTMNGAQVIIKITLK